ncbi:nucleotidyl transferase [Tepidicaulis marinus]|uniref:Bifunctional protein GlmU n=1 Tax=Tepidicaulis marinus TaxID=1333998 RepID=A0A081B7E3_9HYPH|nr:bifunctional UDP-N-acetylglucosamine diphosphorylase/glucosamine-1-phosphate N-acetyltransferase GlmU [Tepidicaulis marinus]GAK43961.1 nucleotidyl transferase [Tepidicaulis marinus]
MSVINSAIIVLAAGKGTRMKSARPKVLHELGGKAMLGHVLASAAACAGDKTVAVLAPGMDDVAEYALSHGATHVAYQKEQNGTGDAVKAAEELLSGLDGVAIVVFGDTPLVTPETLIRMKQACAAGNDVVVLGFQAEDPAPYGRLVLNGEGALVKIVEAKDASPEEAAIDLCNGGAMAVRTPLLFELLNDLKPDNAQGEYYLTDIAAEARARGLSMSVIECPEEEILGINSRLDLAVAEEIFQDRMREQALLNGATLLDPSTVYFSHDTQLGRDVLIGQNVVFGPGVKVDDGAEVKPFSHLEGVHVGAGAQIGPFARLRPGTDVGKKAKIGNFVETKKAKVEDGAKISHLSYIGDARVGVDANIGAGTITCNYDGYDKHFTDIGDGAFVGSNSSLVAPVSIGAGAYVGSGSVVTKNVEPDALAVARGKQFEKKGWAASFRASKEKSKSS